MIPVTMSNAMFQALSLGVLGVFCWMIYTFRGAAAHCVASVFTFRAGDGSGIGKIEKQYYDNFLGVALSLGALSVGLAIVKAAAAVLVEGTGTPGTLGWRLAGFVGTAGVEGIPRWTAPVAAVVVAIVAAAVAAAQTGLLKAAGGVTLSGKFVGTVIQTKKNCLAAASLLVVPMIAVWSGVNPTRDSVVVYLIVGVAVALSVMFVVHTLRGFVKQKVSVLVWFLYLCSVEIFPVAAVVLVAAKSV